MSDPVAAVMGAIGLFPWMCRANGYGLRKTGSIPAPWLSRPIA